jgi:branched-chain amino acid transport system ATP-binding protein
MMSDKLLTITELTAGYGDIEVVRNFSLAVDKGEVVAILGPNGAGKTTVLNTLAGLLPSISGEVSMAGEVIPSGKPAAASTAGMILVPDDRSLFFGLTVEENLKVACKRKSTVTPREALELVPALEARWNLPSGSLSGGEQQMLAVARALMQEPQVLLIDEMSMGLAPIIVEQMLPALRTIAESTGAAVVLVEQHVQLALEVADRALVLVHGNVTLEGTAAELLADRARLEAAYLGPVHSG